MSWRWLRWHQRAFLLIRQRNSRAMDSVWPALTFVASSHEPHRAGTTITGLQVQKTECRTASKSALCVFIRIRGSWSSFLQILTAFCTLFSALVICKTCFFTNSARGVCFTVCNMGGFYEQCRGVCFTVCNSSSSFFVGCKNAITVCNMY